ncbi:MAG: hypothetical protein NTW03_15195 [Verrucomicrobia bacterium]|nr:hypothetical protein [Verrucomicrobiota bacterium]
MDLPRPGVLAVSFSTFIIRLPADSLWVSHARRKLFHLNFLFPKPVE